MFRVKPIRAPRIGFDEVCLEIHAGEGGSDSQNFCFELAAIYLKYAERLGFEKEILSSSESRITLWFKGKTVKAAFDNESGKHVVQRVPPGERNGRRHTSVVGVAVLPIMADIPTLDIRDVSWTAMRGSGPGGQNRNKVASTVRMIHKPTGITVVINERDQGKNRATALRVLTSRVYEFHQSKTAQSYNQWREQQLDGKGRGNKRRTFNYIRQEVTDHITGKTAPSWAIDKGKLELLMNNK